ncbi:MAG: 50S ribosomal protein L34e [Nanoarchaeota archaeon]
MPSGMYKSGRLRKIFVKTPGGRTTIHYRERKPGKAICGNCKKQLSGLPRERPAKIASIPKSARRPERPYGGVLCSACTRSLLRSKARKEESQ